MAFTKALGAGLAEKGIRVNSVAPGPVWTPLIPATMPDEKVESFGEQTPLGRAGQPAELAPAYVFFASQESSYITGEVLGVTGGQPLSAACSCLVTHCGRPRPMARVARTVLPKAQLLGPRGLRVLVAPRVTRGRGD